MGDVVERMIPIWGTYKEAEDFFENPSWGQAGWLLASAASDLASILPIVGPAAKAATTSAITSARAANTIGKAAKVSKARRVVPIAQDMFKAGNKAGKRAWQDWLKKDDITTPVLNTFLVKPSAVTLSLPFREDK